MRKLVLAASAAAVLSTPLCFQVLADNWSTGTGGNSARTGFMNVVGPRRGIVSWQAGLPTELVQAVVADDDVAVGVRTNAISDVMHGSVIVGIHVKTGATLWETELPVEFLISDWRVRVSAIRNGRVYVTRAGNTNSSYLYALDVRNGAELWRADTMVDETSVESLAFASNGDLIVGNFHSIVRIAASDGHTVWSKPRLAPCSDSGFATVFNNRVYFWEAGENGPVVTAMDANLGTRLYSSPSVSGGVFQQVGLMVGPDGTVYAPRTQNNALTDFFVAYRDTGAALLELWRVPMGYTPFASFGVGPDGSVYTYSRRNEILRLAPQTGEIVDRSPEILTDSFSPRMAIDARGTIFLTNGGFETGVLYSFNADLSFRWSVPAPSVGPSGPALASDGSLLVPTSTGLVSYRSITDCPSDWNNDGRLDSIDLFQFLADFFLESADYNGDGRTTSDDIFSFLTPYLAGC